MPVWPPEVLSVSMARQPLPGDPTESRHSSTCLLHFPQNLLLIGEGMCHGDRVPWGPCAMGTMCRGDRVLWGPCVVGAMWLSFQFHPGKTMVWIKKKKKQLVQCHEMNDGGVGTL